MLSLHYILKIWSRKYGIPEMDPDYKEQRMIDPKTLERIQKTCSDATLGNTGMNCQVYARDVGALLKDRQLAWDEVESLRRQLSQALARTETVAGVTIIGAPLVPMPYLKEDGGTR